MFEYPNKLNIIFDKLNKYDIKPIFVGGFVRDFFLKINSKDIDIELYNAKSFEQIAEILKEFANPNIIGKSFGVLKLKVDDLDIDFSLPRLDSKISKGHKGFEVTINSTLDFKTAASRRDFTINAIGFDPHTKKIIDPFNGVDDLKNKILKIINPKTFIEDPLRVLRAMGFCARFELKCDKNLIFICKEMIEQNMLDELPQSRIYNEFKKLFLKSKKPSIGLDFLNQIGALSFFYELKMDSESWINTLNSIDRFCANKLKDDKTNITIVLALLCYELDDKNIDTFIYKLTNKRKLTRVIKSFHHVAKYLQNKSTKLLYKITKNISTEELSAFLNALNISKEKMEIVPFIKPAIDAKKIPIENIKEPKDYSKILQTIYEQQFFWNK